MDLTVGDIGKLVRKIAIPSSVGFLFNTLFNVVDNIFTGYIGSEALAGLAISFPVFFILIALGSGVGTGVTAIISNYIGEGEPEKAREVARDALSLGIIFALVITLVGVYTDELLMKLMGGEGLALTYGLRYTNVIFLGTIFFVMNMVMNGILSAQGDTVSYRNFLIVGFILNIILDPLSILVLGMTTEGVALATVVVQFIGNLYLLKRVRRSKIIAGSPFGLAKPHMGNYMEILSQGLPASFNMMTIAMGVFIINYYVVKVGGSRAVAAFGVAMRIEQLALLPAIGLNIAALSITGQNYGAGRLDRVEETYRKTMKYGLIIMTTAMFLILPLSRYLFYIFTRDIEVIQYGISYFRVETLVFNSYVLLNISVSVLQGLKRPKFPIVIGIYRQFLMPVILFPILIGVIGSIYGIWWGIFAVNWSAAIVAVLHVRGVYLKICKEENRNR